MRKDIAIITARGGSKRIPKKNLKPFLGIPIIDYSIKAALESGLFSQVIVSTDSEEIANHAIDVGASVPFMRSAKNSDDHATTSEVLVEVNEVLMSSGFEYDYFCCIYPTAPFVDASVLHRAKQILITANADSVVPIVKFSFPPQRALVKNGNRISYEFPQYSQMRSQDLSPIYHDCGQFYYCNRASFDMHHNTIMPNSVGIEISELCCQDIDNESDWRIAEMKYRVASEIGCGY